MMHYLWLLSVVSVSMIRGVAWAAEPVRTIKATAIAVATIDGKVEDNYQRALDLTDKALKEKPDIIVLPEAFAAGYCADDLTPYGETFDTSPWLQRFVSRSKDHDCMIVLGFLEKRADGLHNVVAIIDQGKVIGKHSKSKLWPDDQRPYRDERQLVRAGPGKEFFDTRFGRIAILICYENMVPRAYLGLRGNVDLVISPYNCEDDPAKHTSTAARRLACHRSGRTGLDYITGAKAPNWA